MTKKAVLMSIKPSWCDKIASGEKTIEIRKTKPKLETPFKVYIYCTKPSFPHEDFIFTDGGEGEIKGFYGGGKVIGEFVCQKIFPLSFYASEVSFFDTEPPMDVPGTCLTDKEIAAYLGNGKAGYGWLISDLVIYDEPKSLGEFSKPCPNDHYCPTCKYYFSEIRVYGTHVPPCCGYWVDEDSEIKRPTQSWMYVEELE